jgi:hypothetical protein
MIYLLTYLLTHSTQHSPSWEANRFADSQEIPRILWNQKFYYRIHKCPPPVSFLSQLNPVHTSKNYFLKTRLSIMVLSTPGSPQWLRFSHQNPVHASLLPHTRYMSSPPHCSWFSHPQNSGWGVQVIKLLTMKFSLFPCYLISRRTLKV